MTAYCFFEQSGTFKKEFINLGIHAVDCDILNDFNQTDYQIDIFNEIETAYANLTASTQIPTIFDQITPNDLIFAFYPCVAFTEQGIAHIRGHSQCNLNKPQAEKLEYGLRFFNRMHRFYNIFNHFVILCLHNGIPLIIENPNATQHILSLFFNIKPSVVINNRAEFGDYFRKPTNFWFINCEPKNNLILEDVSRKPFSVAKKAPKGIDTQNDIPEFYELCVKHFGKYSKLNAQKTRSLISPVFANRFIREFILDGRVKDDSKNALF